MNTFESMELYGPLKRALAEQNYQQPTPIQAQTIPAALEGNDVLGCAQTGTGKTAAFALPILDLLGREPQRPEKNCPDALVLAPTRELAIQISDSFRVYGKHMRFRQALVYGGVGQSSQVSAMRQGVHVLIATPGRLIDLMDQGHINLRNVEQFVLDEADRMLDMGFLPALKKIIGRLPKERQSLFFSATMPPKIRELAAELLFNPVSVNVTPKVTSVRKIQQRVRLVNRGDKVTLLRDMLNDAEVGQSIVFTRTKRGANALANKLDRAGIGAIAIHGNKSQNARQKALDSFRRERVSVLVATDVAARGIDIDGVTHVFNYDMPVEPESYVHRIGRTGRAGATGIAISLCTVDELEELRAIENEIKQSLPLENPDQIDVRSAPSGGRPNHGGGRRHRSGRPQSGGGGRGRAPARPAKKGRKPASATSVGGQGKRKRSPGRRPASAAR